MNKKGKNDIRRKKQGEKRRYADLITTMPISQILAYLKSFLRKP